MGTHPIFESDFDCLTEMLNRRCVQQLTPRFLSHRYGYKAQLLRLSPESYVQISRNLSISPELLAKIVECPPFADSISEGDISWLKEVGDAVALDETVGEVETDKTSLPVNAPAAGVVTKLLVEDGETVTPGTPLFEMEEGAGGAAPAAPAAKAAEPKPAEAAPAAVGSAGPSRDERRVKMTRMRQRIAQRLKDA